MALFMMCLVVVVGISFGDKNPGIGICFSEGSIAKCIRDMVAMNTGDHIHYKPYKLDDIEGHNGGDLLGWDWRLTNMKVIQAVTPTTEVNLQNRLIHVVMTDFALDIVGNWEIESFKTILGRINEHGNFTLHLSLNMDLGVTIQTGSQYVIVKSCNISAEDVRIRIQDTHHYPKFIMNEINTLTSKTLQKHVQKTICDSKKRIGMDKSHQDWVWSRGLGLLMDMSRFITMSTMKNNGVYVTFPGEVHMINTIPLGNKNPMEAPPIPDPPCSTGKMAEVIMTSYPLSTAIYTCAKRGLFDSELDPSSGTAEEARIFATRCKTVCLGSRIPKLQNMFPTPTFVNVTLKPTDGIKVNIGNGSINVKVNQTALFHVNQIKLFVITMTMELTFIPLVKSNALLVNGRLEYIRLTGIETEFSNVGHIPKDILDIVSDKLFEMNLKPRATDIVTKGFDLTYLLAAFNDYPRTKVENLGAKIAKNVIVFSGDLTVRQS